MSVLRVDVDGVLVEERSAFERTLARPIEGASDVLWQLKADGYEIAVETARGWQERKVTERQLADLDIPWDQMYFGKQIAAATIDDRAIPFRCWEEIPDRLRFPDEDDYLLHLLRRGTKQFIEYIAQMDLPEPILEVGPMDLSSKVFDKHRDTYVDSRTLFSGKQYFSMDMDTSSHPDIVGDLLKADELIEKGSVASLVILNVLEHIPAIWDVPRVIRHMVRQDGLVFCVTPWNIRMHGPAFDSWRLTDLAYRALFSDGFEILSIEKIECPARPLAPVGFICIAKRLGPTLS